MDYESSEYECDIWQGTAVMTCKRTGKVGSFGLKHKGRVATARLIKSDVDKFGAERALRVYAKLVDNWQ